VLMTLGVELKAENLKLQALLESSFVDVVNPQALQEIQENQRNSMRIIRSLMELNYNELARPKYVDVAAKLYKILDKRGLL